MAVSLVRVKPTAGTQGANLGTLTVAFDATGCDYLIVRHTYGADAGGSIATYTVSVATDAGSSMTALAAFRKNSGSASAGQSVYGISLPATGTNNVVITMSGTPGAPEINYEILGFSGVASAALVAGQSADDTNSTSPPNMTATLSSGDMLLGLYNHGDTISATPTTGTMAVINNYSAHTAGGCGCVVYNSGTGSVSVRATSAVSDHWMNDAVKLTASGGGSPQTITAQVGVLTLSGVQGTITPGAVTKTAQVGALTLAGVQGVVTPGAVTKTAQVAALALTGVPGSITAGAATITAQAAQLTLAGVQGALSAGPITITAQVATLTLTGVPGSLSGGGAAPQTITAQVATLTLTGVQGTLTASGATITAQAAQLTLAGVQGVVTPGAITKAAQVAALALTGVPGVVTPGLAVVAAQPALLALTGVQGTLTGGPTTRVAQVATLTLTAVPGVLSGGAQLNVPGTVDITVVAPALTVTVRAPTLTVTARAPTLTITVQGDSP